MDIGTDSKGPSREVKRRAFSTKVVDAIPILPFMAFGFFLAWSQISLQGVLVLPRPTEAFGLPLRNMSSLVNGFTMIIVAFTVVRSERLLSKNWVIILCGCVVGLASLIPLCLADSGLSY